MNTLCFVFLVFSLPCMTFAQGWDQWSAWSTCSRTCDVGRQERTRNCPDPNPAVNCVGDASETQNCVNAAKTSCVLSAQEADFTQWTKWADCSVSCGTGERVRQRECTKNANQAGVQCVGDLVQNMICFRQQCLTAESCADMPGETPACNTWKNNNMCEDHAVRRKCRKTCELCNN